MFPFGLNYPDSNVTEYTNVLRETKIIDYDKSMPEEGDKKSNPDFDKNSDLTIFEIKPFELN